MQPSRFLFFGICFLSSLSFGQFTTYQKPEEAIDKILRADPLPYIDLNRQSTALLKRYAVYLPPISYVARPQVGLAGRRFNPENLKEISNSFDNKMVYLSLKEKKERLLPFPKGSILDNVSWSPNGEEIVLTKESKTCDEIWHFHTKVAKLKRLGKLCLNSVAGKEISWLNDKEVLLTIKTPEQNKKIEQGLQIPTGPTVQDSLGTTSQNRTYPDLIKNAQDESYFEKVAASQLVRVNVRTGAVTKLNQPKVFASISTSPDRQWMMVFQVTKPYSLKVPLELFGGHWEIWSTRSGQKLSEFGKREALENLPIQGVPIGPRDYHWIFNLPATLAYKQALDGGDWANKADFRDELFFQKVDVKGQLLQPQAILKTKGRLVDLESLNKEGLYFVDEYERETEWFTRHLVTLNRALDKDKIATRVAFSVSTNDDYKSPGRVLRQLNAFGKLVVGLYEEEGKTYFYTSDKGATPEGDRPVVKRYSLEDFKEEEIFRSAKNAYERFVTFVGDDPQTLLTKYETSTESPSYRIRKRGGSDFELLSRDANPYDVFSKVKKELIQYNRAGGVQLSGLLYYPVDYVPGKKYPVVIEGYPLEYTDAQVAGQVRGSQNRYSQPYGASHLYLTLRGYFLLTNAQMPIIGPPETKNDTFIPQLVSNGKAAVDALDAKGLIDRKRVGVIGHSYGAFMVAHFLTHSDLFAAGVARSGAYNRTLTPFGFQGERRPFWKAKNAYIQLSPFMDAEKMKKPLLLIHGQKDNNTGTFTMQSERYFDALKGQGARARLVLLPEESHGYDALESVEHVLYETFKWYDTYLKETQ